MFESIAWAMGPAPQGGQEGGIGALISPLLLFILIFIIFYFLLIRPQQKRQKEHQKMLESLKRGDKVITAGGIYGVVESVGTNTVTLKIAENVKVKFGKGYIAAKRPDTEED